VATGIRENAFGFNHLLARDRAARHGLRRDRDMARFFELARFSGAMWRSSRRETLYRLREQEATWCLKPPPN